VAATAAALMLGRGRRDVAYDVTGPEAVTWRQVAALITEFSGVPIEVVDLTDDEMYAMWDALGVPRAATGDFSRSPVPWCSDGMVSLGRAIRMGQLSTVTDTVEELTGHRPKTLRELMKEKAPSWPTMRCGLSTNSGPRSRAARTASGRARGVATAGEVIAPPQQ
jgi:NAD(P)H dehydrogenase (quinone)